MELIDNINRLLGDDLKQTVRPGARLKLAAACLSMYAFEALKVELEKIDALEFIFTSPTFVARECADWIQRKVRFRSNRSAVQINVEQVFKSLSPAADVKCV